MPPPSRRSAPGSSPGLTGVGEPPPDTRSRRCRARCRARGGAVGARGPALTAAARRRMRRRCCRARWRVRRAGAHRARCEDPPATGARRRAAGVRPRANAAARRLRQLGHGPAGSVTVGCSHGRARAGRSVGHDRRGRTAGGIGRIEEGLEAVPATLLGLRARFRRGSRRTRLRARPDRRRQLSSEALAAARELGDPRALAAALDARHVVLWGPDHTLARLPLADEMVSLAMRAHDPSLELQARNWRILDLENSATGRGWTASWRRTHHSGAMARLPTPGTCRHGERCGRTGRRPREARRAPAPGDRLGSPPATSTFSSRRAFITSLSARRWRPE